MNLVTFEDPIWATIQGEGMFVGVPTVFVRLHGCDYDCSWCDTKGSWEPGSKYDSVTVDTVFEKVQKLREDNGIQHVVITGGNPVLQGDEVASLIGELQSARRKTPPAIVTVETQGSFYHEGVIGGCDLLSLSPKIHKWPTDTLDEILFQRRRIYRFSGIAKTQLKVVVYDDDSALMAVRYMYEACKKFGGLGLRDGLILQPEFSSGRTGKDAAVRASMLGPTVVWDDHGPAPIIKVIPQVHKHLAVRL